MPEKGSWQAGFETNIVLERDAKDYQEVRSNQYFYNLSFGFTDWFCFDGKLGMGDIETESSVVPDADYEINFAGGYGWRAKLFHDKKTNLKCILGFEHISVHPSDKDINGRSYEIIWDDWQLQAVLSKKIGRLNPYCGAKWSVLYIIRRIEGDRTRRHSYDDNIGLIAGADMRVNDYIFMNVEGRFFDETALSAGFTIRY